MSTNTETLPGAQGGVIWWLGVFAVCAALTWMGIDPYASPLADTATPSAQGQSR